MEVNSPARGRQNSRFLQSAAPPSEHKASGLAKTGEENMANYTLFFQPSSKGAEKSSLPVSRKGKRIGIIVRN